MMSTRLKIKLKSLAEEVRIIRKEESKLKGQWAWKAQRLYEHRISHLRPIIRNTHIAYGFIKGHLYHKIETNFKTYPDWSEVKTMIKKYGSREDYEKVVKFVEGKTWVYEHNYYQLKCSKKTAEAIYGQAIG